MDLEHFVPLTVIQVPGEIKREKLLFVHGLNKFQLLIYLFLTIFQCFRRDAILGKLRSEGVNCGGCGDNAIRLRPALIFQPKHANIFLEKLEKVLKAL